MVYSSEVMALSYLVGTVFENQLEKFQHEALSELKAGYGQGGDNFADIERSGLELALGGSKDPTKTLRLTKLLLSL